MTRFSLLTLVSTLTFAACGSPSPGQPRVAADDIAVAEENAVLRRLASHGDADIEIVLELGDIAPPLSAMNIGRAESDGERAAIIAAREALVTELHTALAAEIGVEMRGVLWLPNASIVYGSARRILAYLRAHPEVHASFDGPAVSEGL